MSYDHCLMINQRIGIRSQASANFSDHWMIDTLFVYLFPNQPIEKNSDCQDLYNLIQTSKKIKNKLMKFLIQNYRFPLSKINGLNDDQLNSIRCLSVDHTI